MLDPNPRSPIATSPISVILFAHAFSTDKQEALSSWRRCLDTLGRAYEITVIQETRPEVPPAAEESATPIRIITYDRAAGFRDAVNDAIRSAQHPLLAFCTCDKQYQPADLEGMLKVIDKVDLVVGYRTGGQAPPWRVLLDTFLGIASRILIGVPSERRVCWLGSEGWGRRWIARWIFGVRVLDPECPFRLARRSIFEHIPIQSSGPFLQVELLAKANHLTCFLAEEPVSWTPPSSPLTEAISFGQDARLVFRDPDFGPFHPPAAAPANP
jgi:hypothetical protein